MSKWRSDHIIYKLIIDEYSGNWTFAHYLAVVLRGHFCSYKSAGIPQS